MQILEQLISPIGNYIFSDNEISFSNTFYCRVYVEGGLSYDGSKLLVPAVQNTADAEKLRIYSPINLAHQVKCPTLLHLGTKDIRVPMSQGLIYYRTLLSHGKDVK